MLRSDDPPVPVLKHPAAKFIELVSLLLKDMQKKFGSQKSVPGHDTDKNYEEDVNKRKVPAQSIIFIGVNILYVERSLKYTSSVIFMT